MIAYPTWLQPEIFSIGPLTLRWYGLMYVIGYIIGAWILRRRVRQGLFTTTEATADQLINYLFVGMLVGARLVYCFVYNWDEISQNLLDIFKVWRGGLSFHGAMIGMIVGCWLYARRYRVPVYMTLDTLAMCAPPGLFFGRWGNFINGELWGRETTMPWGMVFPHDPAHLPRHPSQIYESLGEGLLLGLFLWSLQRLWLSRGTYKHGRLGSMFVIAYGVIRFFLEFFREPDAQLGYVLGPFSMGQLLCFLMILAGTAMWIHSNKINRPFVPKPVAPAG